MLKSIDFSIFFVAGKVGEDKQAPTEYDEWCVSVDSKQAHALSDVGIYEAYKGHFCIEYKLTPLLHPTLFKVDKKRYYKETIRYKRNATPADIG